MIIKENLTKVNYSPMQNKVNKYIVIHYVGAVSSAYNNSVYFKNVNRNASANYFVDENEIYRVVKDSDRAWHCGDKGIGEYKDKCTNSNSIGIEMCCYNNNGKLDISEKVIANTIELTKELMSRYNIPAENVIRHYDVTKKMCPAPFIENQARWLDFKTRLGQISAKVQPKTDEKKGVISEIQATLNKKYGFGIGVDNIYGPETKGALVMALQTELNKQFKKNLKIDGAFGDKTKNACVNVKRGASGNITYILQAILFCKGYQITVNGIFEKNTESVVREFQKQNGLNVDGIAGPNTFAKLFS